MHFDFTPTLSQNFRGPSHQHGAKIRDLGAWLSQSRTFGSLAAAFGACFLRLRQGTIGSTNARCKHARQGHGIFSAVGEASPSEAWHFPAGPLRRQVVVALNKLYCIQDVI